VGIIGAGKFASMFLAQALHTRGIHIMAVCDIEVARAQATLDRLDWPQGRTAVTSFAQAVKDGTTYITDDAAGLIAADHMESPG
jgi:predicted homoserine dehydrogenase-like protein